MLQSYVLRSWLLALAASATLGVMVVSVWGVEPTVPAGKKTANAGSTASQETQTAANSGQKSSALSKLSATARGEPITDSDFDETVNSSSDFDEELVPEKLRDRGFDRYIDLALLCKAWDEKNASALADVALEIREGERILLRPYRGFSSQQLLHEAARIAVETKDKAALQRLGKIAEVTGSAELKAKLAGAEKLAGEARATEPALQVSIAEVTPEVYAQLWDDLHTIQDASLAGDTTTLKEMKDELAANTVIPEKQKKYLEKLLQESQATAAAMPESQKQLSQSLDKLSDISRGHGGGGHGGGGHGGGGHGGGGPSSHHAGKSHSHAAHHPNITHSHNHQHSHHDSHGIHNPGHRHDRDHWRYDHGHWCHGYWNGGVWSFDGGYDVDATLAGGDVVSGGLFFENLKDKPIHVAIVYADANSAGMVSGWYDVDPGQNVCVLNGPLTAQVYYYYAYSDDSKWEGDNEYYVDPNDSFAYDSQDQGAVNNVAQQGYEQHGFSPIDTQGAATFTQRLQ